MDAIAQRGLQMLLVTLIAGSACSGDGLGSPAAICGAAEFESLPAVLEPLESLAEGERAEITEALAAAGHQEGRLWQVVLDGDDVVLFGSPTDHNFPYGHATFRRSEDSLTLVAADNCNLVFDANGLSIASFRLDPREPLGPESVSVPILFTEKACAGGGALAGRAVKPSVFETADRVEIVVLVEAHEEPQTCPGNSEVSWVVELEAPIGNRSIADASAIPSRRVG